MNMLRFIDCNCMVGLPATAHEFKICLPDEIEYIERKFGITASYAYHIAAFDLHPIDGNHAIDTVCESNSFFRPVWVLLPNDTGEFYDPPELMLRMKQHSVQMARIFPRYNDHGFLISTWSCGTLINELAEAGMPLLMDAEQAEWDQINTLMSAFPKLKLIITNLYYRYGRIMLSLMKRHKNLFCETSGLRSFELLQTFCESVGVTQLVFGTGMGLYSAGSAVSMITYARIQQEEKEAIANGNLCRILETDVD